MLEHRMQAYYSYLVGRKRGMYGLGLRYAMGNTAWAKHLKGVQNHDRASQGIQRYILLRVQPLASHPGGCLFVGDAGRSEESRVGKEGVSTWRSRWWP